MPPSGSYFGGPFKRVNGTAVSQEPIIAPAVAATALSGAFVATTENRMQRTGLRVIIFGTSSSAYGSTTDVVAASTSEFNEYPSGYWPWANIVSGVDATLVFNGAVPGVEDSVTLSNISTKLQTAPDFDVAILQMGAASIVRSDFDPANILVGVRALLPRAKRIIVDIPHMRNPSPVPASKYAAMRTYVQNVIVAQYPGRIFIADRFGQLSEPHGSTPLEWLSADGVHLNFQGAYQAGLKAYAPVFAQVFGASSGPCDYNAYGTPIAVLTGANATAANATVVADADSAFGVKQWLVTSSADNGGSSLTLAVSGLSTSKRYRLRPDYDIVKAVASPEGAPTTGCKWGTPNRRHLAATLSGMNNAALPEVTIRTLAAEFIPTATNGVITLYTGQSGSVLRLRSIALFESP